MCFFILLGLCVFYSTEFVFFSLLYGLGGRFLGLSYLRDVQACDDEFTIDQLGRTVHSPSAQAMQAC